jgi:hypothetical protein
MPYPHEHSARMISPDRFEKDTFRRKALGKGISAVMGKLPGKGAMVIQSYRFDAEDFTLDQVKEWLKSHDLNPSSVEEATGEKAKIKSFVQLGVIIPTSTLETIKKTDEHPFFQAYSIAHEGVSNPTNLDLEQKPIRWFRKSIQSIKNAVLKGLKFFIGHNDDNSTDNRESVGEVVADTQRVIDGKLHHIVVGYFPDRERVENLDICSQESTWNLWDYAKEYVAGALDKITGIALSDSRVDRPAFSGAKRLGLIQAFEPVRAGAGEKGEKKMELQTVPTDEIVRELKRRQTKPTELFSIDEIKGLDEFKAIVKQGEELKAKVAESAKTIETLTKEKGEIGRKVELVTAKDRLKSIAEGKKATPKQLDFVTTSFSDKVTDLSDAGLSAFVDEKFAEYKKNAEFFGFKDGDKPPAAKKEDNKGEPEKPEDYMDPAYNELLPKAPTE